MQIDRSERSLCCCVSGKCVSNKTDTGGKIDREFESVTPVPVLKCHCHGGNQVFEPGKTAKRRRYQAHSPLLWFRDSTSPNGGTSSLDSGHLGGDETGPGHVRPLRHRRIHPAKEMVLMALLNVCPDIVVEI